jgi:ATP-dependent RNA helicase A
LTNINTACGNSTSKKDAQSNAAKDFISYLIRQGQMNPEEVPSEAGLKTEAGPSSSVGLGLVQPRVFQVI